MTAALSLVRPRLTREFAIRSLAGGLAWGVLMAAAFIATAVWTCGGICPDDALITLASCTGVGLATVGPACALTRRPS